MKWKKTVLQAADGMVTVLLALMLALAGIYAGYSLWDNHRILAETDDVRADMLLYKPDVSTPEGCKNVQQTFAEMRGINPDICAWLTVDNTGIDYPVLIGETNLTYINTDVYGEFSLGGSLFFDSRCARDFSDPYALIYGHHMAGGKMFGDLDKFREEAFFRQNETGTLILPETVYHLDIFAVLVTTSSEPQIFDLDKAFSAAELLRFVNANALFTDKVQTEQMQKQPNKILAFATCSSDFTDARTVVLATATE